MFCNKYYIFFCFYLFNTQVLEILRGSELYNPHLIQTVAGDDQMTRDLGGGLMTPVRVGGCVGGFVGGCVGGCGRVCAGVGGQVEVLSYTTLISYKLSPGTIR